LAKVKALLKAHPDLISSKDTNAGNAQIVRERMDEFTNRMEKDLKELKRALLRSGASMLLSKEFGVSVEAANCCFNFGTIAAVC